MSNNTLPFSRLSNDLYCNVHCVCGEIVRLIGYADSYFFDVVNKEPNHKACSCGRAIEYRWTRDGVHVNAEATQ